MKQISSVDLSFIIKELKQLDGGKINKIYSQEKKDIILDVYTRGMGKIFLVVDDCKYVYLSTKKEEVEEPSGFCMFLRKRLKNGIIEEISQEGVERILKLKITVMEETLVNYYLYFELFAKGNIILCDGKNNIVGLSERQIWKDRDVRTNSIYVSPKVELSYRDITVNNLVSEVKKNGSLVKALASSLGLGGIYAEEVCLRAGIDKNLSEINEDDATNILNRLDNILDSKIFPKIVYHSGEGDVGKGDILMVTPIELEIFKDNESKSCESISACFEEVLSVSRKEVKEDKKLSKYNEKINQLKNRVEEQELQIEEMGGKIVENQNKGNLLYENYQYVKEIIDGVKIDIKEKGLDDAKKSSKDKFGGKVKIIDPRRVEISL